MLQSATCSEDYARQRIENSPLRKIYSKSALEDPQVNKIEGKTKMLDTQSYKCAQTALAGLIIRLHYSTKAPLSEISETLTSEAKSLCAANISYVTEIFTANQKELDEEEEVDPRDDNDREEDVEEEEERANY